MVYIVNTVSISNTILAENMFMLLSAFFLTTVMGYEVSGTEISERPVRFNGENFLQFKHRYGRRLE